MVLAKTQIRSRIEAENAQREKKIAQLNEFIARFSAGTRSSQVTSRKKEVERLQTSELAQVQHPAAVHPLRDEASVGPAPARSQRAHASPTTTCKVIDNFTASISRGEKIALMGRNGAGKTTLLKSLIRSAPGVIEEPTALRRRQRASWSGATRWRSATSPRTTPIRSRTDTTAIEWLHEFDPQASQEELRGLLGQMLFSGEDALKPTKALSGGEAARLIFCRLMLQKPNVLVLDEPTNHLDLEAINALNIALQKYEGTVLLVTPRSRPDRRSRHADLALRGRPHRRLQGPVRRVRRLRAGEGVVEFASTVFPYISRTVDRPTCLSPPSRVCRFDPRSRRG